jgi:hypothetical protein
MLLPGDLKAGTLVLLVPTDPTPRMDDVWLALETGDLSEVVLSSTLVKASMESMMLMDGGGVLVPKAGDDTE